MRVVVSAHNGTLSLASRSGLYVSSGAATKSSKISFLGSLPRVNDALQALVYRPALDFYGTDTLTVLAEVHISSWTDYLSIKQSILSDLKRIIAFVRQLKQSISIARDTPLASIDRVPELIADVVNRDNQLKLKVCRLATISDYSIDFIVLIDSSHAEIGDLLNGLGRMHRGILDSFNANGIEIPLPTSVEIHKTLS